MALARHSVPSTLMPGASRPAHARGCTARQLVSSPGLEGRLARGKVHPCPACVERGAAAPAGRPRSAAAVRVVCGRRRGR